MGLAEAGAYRPSDRGPAARSAATGADSAPSCRYRAAHRTADRRRYCHRQAGPQGVSVHRSPAATGDPFGERLRRALRMIVPWRPDDASGDANLVGWFKLAYDAAPREVLLAMGAALVATVSKLASILAGVVAIQTELTRGADIGGPWAAVDAIPISGSGLWLAVSVAAAIAAVMSDKWTQNLRAAASEAACKRWLRGSGDSSRPVALTDIGKVARSTTFALLAAAAISEIGVVFSALVAIHPASAVVSIAGLILYLLSDRIRGDRQSEEPPIPKDRGELLTVYREILDNLPADATARRTVTRRVGSEPAILAPARSFLSVQTKRMRQAGEAPGFLAVIIVVLYVLALLESDDAPIAGAATLAVSFLLLRLAVGALIRLQRSRSAARSTWKGARPDARAHEHDGDLESVLRAAPRASVLLGMTRAQAVDLVRETFGGMHVVSVGALKTVRSGLEVGELVDRAKATSLAGRLSVRLEDDEALDYASSRPETRLLVSLSHHDPDRTVLIVSIDAWNDFTDVVRSELPAIPARLLLVHPTPRSSLPDEFSHVVYVDEQGEIAFDGALAAYRRAEVWKT
jgi:hypothetical protein